jgi:molybdenum cofactor synthesis domain-containing protein
MKQIKTTDAIGHVLAHDLTQIIPGKFKGVRFSKGHIVQPEDIEVLLSMGKENLYVWEKQEGILHENEAAEILKDLCINEYMKSSDVKEGKIEITADADGLFVINRPALLALNSFGQMMAATRHGDLPVKKGDKLAGMRIIPLVIEKEKMDALQDAVHEITKEPIFTLIPFTEKKAVVLVSGNEVYSGRIQDAFGPRIEKKLAEYGSSILYKKILPDDPKLQTEEILKAKEAGADLILCTGGMSVDPDDQTPNAIAASGADIITYGAPVLPGAMLMMADLDGTPVLGLPGCVMYGKRTVFDLVLPRILAGQKVTKEELASLGEGGLCLQCDVCTWPACSFGK